MARATGVGVTMYALCLGKKVEGQRVRDSVGDPGHAAAAQHCRGEGLPAVLRNREVRQGGRGEGNMARKARQRRWGTRCSEGDRCTVAGYIADERV